MDVSPSEPASTDSTAPRTRARSCGRQPGHGALRGHERVVLLEGRSAVRDRRDEDVGARQPGVALDEGQGGDPVAVRAGREDAGDVRRRQGLGVKCARFPQYAFHPGGAVPARRLARAHLLVAGPHGPRRRHQASSAALELFGALELTGGPGPTRLLEGAAGLSLQLEADAGRLDRLDAVAEHREARDHDPGRHQRRGPQRVVGPEHRHRAGDQGGAPTATPAIRAGRVSTGVEAGGDDSDMRSA